MSRATRAPYPPVLGAPAPDLDVGISPHRPRTTGPKVRIERGAAYPIGPAVDVARERAPPRGVRLRHEERAMKWPSLRVARAAKWTALPVAVLASGLIISIGSYSAFKSTTTNPG